MTSGHFYDFDLDDIVDCRCDCGADERRCQMLRMLKKRVSLRPLLEVKRSLR